MSVKPNWMKEIKAETRCNGDIRSLVVVVEPDVQTPGLRYCDLMAHVQGVFMRTYGDCGDWVAKDADVMAWSDDGVGIFVPKLYRVTVDFRRKGE